MLFMQRFRSIQSRSVSDGEDPRIPRTRQAVFAAALELAAECGFAGATIEAISRRAGVAKSTIYRHWHDTSSLFLDALETAAVDHIAVDTGTLRDDCVHLMLELAHILTEGAFGQLLPQLIAAGSIDDKLAEVQASYVANRQHVNTEVFARAVQRGELSSDRDLGQVQELLVAPLMYRHLVSRQPINDQWVINHTDTTLTLITTP